MAIGSSRVLEARKVPWCLRLLVSVAWDSIIVELWVSDPTMSCQYNWGHVCDHSFQEAVWTLICWAFNSCQSLPSSLHALHRFKPRHWVLRWYYPHCLEKEAHFQVRSILTKISVLLMSQMKGIYTGIYKIEWGSSIPARKGRISSQAFVWTFFPSDLPEVVVMSNHSLLDSAFDLG